MKLRPTVFLTISALWLACVLAYGHPQNKPKQSAGPAQKTGPDKDTEEIVIETKSGRHFDRTDEGDGTGFVAVDKDTTVTADKAKWNNKTKIAEATGNLKMTDPQADATGEKGVVYFAKS